MSIDFSDLKALYLNCSLKQSVSASHTQKLLDKSAKIMQENGVEVKHIYVLDHKIPFGMEMDLNPEGITDDYPMIHNAIMEADILVIGTPIWLGQKSSVATLIIERMYAYSGETNPKGQYIYYGKTGGCIVTGNEDGLKHCAMDVLYGLSHIGYTIPPQADAGWLGEVGPGPSYGDIKYNGKYVNEDKTPAGFDSEFTNRNTTFMAYNLMHCAKMLKDSGAYPAIGNTSESWETLPNATQF